MANQYVNKVIVNNEIKMDLTEDTIMPNTLRKGFTAHDASGAPIVGTDDTALKALEAIAPIEGDISSANYTVGAYLIHNNQLCKVTVAIATNEAITEGSNVTPVTLSDDVKYLIDHPYILPTMSESTKGGAKVGYGLNVENDILSVGGVDDPNDAGPIVKLNANGWAEQNTTSGKNLAPRFVPATMNGLTFTTNSDGSVTVKGKSTGATTIYNGETANYSTGTYTISGCPSGGASGTYQLDLRTTDGAIVEDSRDRGSGKTFTISEAGTYRPTIRFAAGYTCPSGGLTFYPQIELGSQATTYEPYTGGAPSPSPSYPQEIKVCRGRNLLDASTAIVGKAWNLNDNSARAIVNVEVEPSTAYTISNISGGFNPLYVYEKASASDTTYITNYDVNARTSRIITTDASTKCICIQFNKDAIILSDITAEQVQLELGSVAHPYVPYGHVGVDVTANGTTTTIPIPLPERGYVASLPDGTSDILTLDGAGRYEWVENTEECVIDGSTYKSTSKSTYTNGYRHGIVLDAGCDTSNRVNFYATRFIPSTRALTNAQALVGDAVIYPYDNTPTLLAMSSIQEVADFNTWLSQNPVTILYPLAISQTESGYIDYDNTIPVHAIISSADLEGIEVRCIADSRAAEISAAWGKRIENELNSLREIVNTLLANS